jgi:hypothetical protein
VTSSFCTTILLVVWNATTYTRDWLRHLVDDEAPLQKKACVVMNQNEFLITDKTIKFVHYFCSIFVLLTLSERPSLGLFLHYTMFQ